MKILHMVNTYARAGGIETYVMDLLPLLEARGLENCLIFRADHPRTPSIEGQPIYHIPVSDNPIADQIRVREVIERERPSVAYLHDVYEPKLMEMVASLVPSVAYVHIFYPVCPGLGKLFHKGDEVCERAYGLGCIPNIYLRRCATARHPLSVYKIMRTTGQHIQAYRKLPKVLVGSTYINELMAQNGVLPQRLETIPLFIPIPDKKELIAPPVAEEPQGILFAGRLEYEKGVPYLLQAIKLLKNNHHLYIAGDGSRGEEYRQLANRLGVTEQVTFIEWLGHKELEHLYRQCAVTVMPTIMPEPFGKVGVEAMANGRPVVAFDVGGIPDWLKDGHNGFLVPPRDVATLAQRIDQILGDATLRETLGANGRQFVEANYTVDRHLDGLIRVLEETAQKGVNG